VTTLQEHCNGVVRPGAPLTTVRRLSSKIELRGVAAGGWVRRRDDRCHLNPDPRDCRGWAAAANIQMWLRDTPILHIEGYESVPARLSVSTSEATT
jgi:hypothetical protein